VFVRDALHYRQPGSIAFEFVRAVETLKHAEQFTGVRHLESNPVVLDPKPYLAVYFHWLYPDRGTLAGTGELDRVREQVGDGDPGKSGVTLDGWKLLDLPVEHASIVGRTELTSVVRLTSRRNKSCRPIRESPTRSSTSVAIWSAAWWIRSA
jgi:hypothetical protein